MLLIAILQYATMIAGLAAIVFAIPVLSSEFRSTVALERDTRNMRR